MKKGISYTTLLANFKRKEAGGIVAEVRSIFRSFQRIRLQQAKVEQALAQIEAMHKTIQAKPITGSHSSHPKPRRRVD